LHKSQTDCHKITQKPRRDGSAGVSLLQMTIHVCAIGFVVVSA